MECVRTLGLGVDAGVGGGNGTAVPLERSMQP